MTCEEYRKVMIMVLKHQQSYWEADDKYADGIWHGLKIAIDKLEQSKFLTEALED